MQGGRQGNDEFLLGQVEFMAGSLNVQDWSSGKKPVQSTDLGVVGIEMVTEAMGSR